MYRSTFTMIFVLPDKTQNNSVQNVYEFNKHNFARKRSV